MVNALSKITAALLAVLLLFLFPALQAAQRQEDIRYLAAYRTLVQFTDAVRNKGIVTPKMYEDFIREIEITGEGMRLNWNTGIKPIIRNTVIRPTPRPS